MSITATVHTNVGSGVLLSVVVEAPKYNRVYWSQSVFSAMTTDVVLISQNIRAAFAGDRNCEALSCYCNISNECWGLDDSWPSGKVFVYLLSIASLSDGFSG